MVKEEELRIKQKLIKYSYQQKFLPNECDIRSTWGLASEIHGKK